jgi:hypothetical protein
MLMQLTGFTALQLTLTAGELGCMMLFIGCALLMV